MKNRTPRARYIAKRPPAAGLERVALRSEQPCAATPMGSREDVAALKRLVGEAFRELLDARTRLKALEEHTGLARAFTMGSLAAAPKSQRATQWSLRLNGGASSSAPHAAPLLELCADTSLRKGSDTLSASLSSPLKVGESGVACGAFTLTRLAYRARLSRRARLLVRLSPAAPARDA